MKYTFTITLYNLDLLILLVAWFLLSCLIYKLLKALKRLIGKTIIKLEKKGMI